jgi:hypothetical protein
LTAECTVMTDVTIVHVYVSRVHPEISRFFKSILFSVHIVVSKMPLSHAVHVLIFISIYFSDQAKLGSRPERLFYDF